jgi:Zn-dependent peptidase ImmA (M78 family)/DNA-binding XRE family transcriptional regulator
MSTMTITGEVFRWAIERAGFSDEKLALRLHTKPEKIIAWETGKEYPNFQQAQKLASTLSIPLGYLFLSDPPEITVPIADFRTLPGKPSTSISLNLQDLLDDALRKRDWYSEWRKSEGLAPFEFIGKFTIQDKPSDIVQDMRQVLDIPPDYASHMKTWDDHLRLFVQKVEHCGILVLQSGIVGNNTHRKLSLEEFRGFTLADKYAPLIFVNAQDSIAARIFTIVHELTHLWTGTSGISNPEIAPGDFEVQQIELFCNKIAADFLVPQEILDTMENTQILARYFRVSAQVILRRSYDLGIIPSDEYFATYQEILKLGNAGKKGSGGDFYNSFFSRNSRRFTRILISAIASGNLSYLDAARLLNTQPRSIANAIERMG